jgi:hypothetical protein
MKAQTIYTLSQIRRHNNDSGFYYFSKDTMKFFHQVMRDFSVRLAGGRVFVTAPLRPRGKFLGYSFAEYFPATGEVNKSEIKKKAGEFLTKNEVESFIINLRMEAKRNGKK